MAYVVEGYDPRSTDPTSDLRDVTGAEGSADAGMEDIWGIGGGLTPAMIMAMMRRRLRDIDQQVQLTTQAIEGDTRMANELSRQLEALSKVQEVGSSRLDGDIHYDRGDGIDMIEHDGESVTVKEYLEKMGIEITTTEREDFTVIDDGALQAKIDGVKQMLQRVNSRNEMRMVSLQSSMQQRSEIVNLGSNMLAQLHEQTEAIINNIR